MRILIIIIMIFLKFSFVEAQSVSASFDKISKFVYVGIDNPLTIIAENISCKDLVVKSSIGEIVGDSCRYIFRCNDSIYAWNKATIIVYHKLNDKLFKIKEIEFRLRNVTNLIATVYGESGGMIKPELIWNAESMKLKFDEFGYDSDLQIDSFTLSIIRGDSCIVNNIRNTGNQFNVEIKNVLKKIRSDDIVIFKQINCSAKSNLINEIKPITFFIK